MKLRLLFILFFFQQGHASINSKTLNIVGKHQLYYSSYTLLKDLYRTNSKSETKKFEIILENIHPSVFIHDEELDQFNQAVGPFDFAIGVRQFFRNNLSLAEKKAKLGKSK